MKRALITGITGQDGSLFSRIFIKQGIQSLWFRRNCYPKLNNIKHLLDEIE